MKRAIEEYFPIVDINRLAVTERNAFKPIYQMHKWFARRSSSVFRAILLGAIKPASADIMAEFYKDHTNDTDTNGKVVVDPFMGGGTTVVEALRMGCQVTGIDLNPVAWFVVKTEVHPISQEKLRTAFDNLAERSVGWSGKSIRETLRACYKTACPRCGSLDADVLYTFWVKSAPCTTANCTCHTPLFQNYVISQLKPSIRYFPNVECPSCNKSFDYEIDVTTLVGDPNLRVAATRFSAGEGRTSTRWTYGVGGKANCPWCSVEVHPQVTTAKTKRKRVQLSILLCPACEEVWQHRGDLPEIVSCPACAHSYKPFEGNVPERGKFICRGTCNGNIDSVMNAIKAMPDDTLLPTHAYALEGYCAQCVRSKGAHIDVPELFDSGSTQFGDECPDATTDSQPSPRVGGKFFKRFDANDQVTYQNAVAAFEKNRHVLPYPVSTIPPGEKTSSGLLAHHYRHWYKIFNERQLLCLSTLLAGITEESDEAVREYLLLAFSASLERNNMFCRYFNDRNTIQGSFDRHDFAPKNTPAENSVWGQASIRGTYENMFLRMIEGLKYRNTVYDYARGPNKADNRCIPSLEEVSSENVHLICGDSQEELPKLKDAADVVITDPPYAGNVNYSELSDFFYVWLRLILKDSYAAFQPEYTPKSQEIVENRSRGLSNHEFRNRLQRVFTECARLLPTEGLCVFTYHHSEDAQWVDLCDAITQAGFIIESVYPVHGEKESSLLLQNSEGISYDLVHVCKKRPSDHTSQKRAWPAVRREIRQRAREELQVIESGRYGARDMSVADVNILLIGKCLEIYSKHYNSIVDHEDHVVPISVALREIRMIADQMVAKERRIPAELEDIDLPSYIYFSVLFAKKEIRSDDVSKVTKGIIEVSELKERGLIRKGREKGGRTFEVKQPLERLNDLRLTFDHSPASVQNSFFLEDNMRVQNDALFVDYVHFLLATVETGDSVLPWLERFGGLRTQLRAAMAFLAGNKAFEQGAKRILDLIDGLPLFKSKG